MAADYALDRPFCLPTARKAASIPQMSAAAPTDEELLARVGHRDHAAFETLYRRYSRSVLGLALRRLGDRGRAEDALQETFAAIWRAAKTYKPERGPAAPWLFAVARNSIADRGRARREPPAEAPDEPSSDAGPDEQAEFSWVSWRVHSALEVLPDRERSLIASTLQRSLLPPELPDIPGFQLAGAYQAAGEQNDVGGDFYDAFAVPGGWMVLVGDVAGRGAEAAALTSLSRYTLRTAGRLLGDPIAAFEQLNHALREREGLSLVSVCCVLLRAAGESARAEVVLAGHPPAYRVRSGIPSPVGVFAPFLGAYERGGWEVVAIDLAAGDQLVLYTDGVIDAVGEEERFGEERLIATLGEGRGAADTVARIERAVGQFALGPQVDDMAIIVVERTGRG